MHTSHAPGLLPLVALAAVLAAYLAAARAQRRAGRRWPAGRTAAFAGGVALLAVAAAPPLAAWAHGDLRGHMVQHVLVGMLAPLGLVLGAPVTLVLRTAPVPAARRISRALRSGLVRVVSHPAAAALLNVGGMTALYLTPLYAAMQGSAVLHAAVHGHVVLAGALFAWSVLGGPDPAPHPAPLRTRRRSCSRSRSPRTRSWAR